MTTPDSSTSNPPASLRDAFFAACAGGDVEALRDMLRATPRLIDARRDGATGLHAALQHPAAIRLLLAHGADPNVREEGDHALPLHFAAGGAPIETVRALLDAGSDVTGAGDAHLLEAIGWATVFAEPRRDVVALLVERGAQHHVFSAIALGDLDELRRVVDRDRLALARRLSPTEQEQTSLHYVIAPPDGLVGGTFRTGDHYRTLELLLALGADVEAVDAKGRTPLAVAMLRGDERAMQHLQGGGARQPDWAGGGAEKVPAAELARSVHAIAPMLAVPDVDATVAWYLAMGFALTGSHGEAGRMDFAAVSLGDAEVMFVPASHRMRVASTGVSLWLRTSRIEAIYLTFRQRQVEWARAAGTGAVTRPPAAPFQLDLHTTFYGQREFHVVDPNGVELCFCQADETGD